MNLQLSQAFAQARKAFLAAGLAALGVIGKAATAGQISQNDVAAAVALGIVTFIGVYFAVNAPKPAAPAAPQTPPAPAA